MEYYTAVKNYFCKYFYNLEKTHGIFLSKEARYKIWNTRGTTYVKNYTASFYRFHGIEFFPHMLTYLQRLTLSEKQHCIKCNRTVLVAHKVTMHSQMMVS